MDALVVLGLKLNSTFKGRLRMVHVDGTIHCHLTACCHLTSCAPQGRLRQPRLLLSGLAVTTRVAEGQVNYSSLIYRPVSSSRNPMARATNREATDLLCSSFLKEAGLW